MLLTSLSFYIYNDIEVKNNTISTELKRLSLQRELIDEVTSKLTGLYQSVDSYLLDPTDKSNTKMITFYLSMIDNAGNELYKNDHHNQESTHLDSIALKENLSHLSVNVKELIDLRSDVSKQMPGLALSANGMAEVQNKLKSQLEILVNEVEEGDTINNPSIYPKLLKTQNLFEKQVSQLRIYLSNRLASFTVEILPTQADSLKMIHLKTESYIKELQELYKNESDSFAGNEIIKVAFDAEQEWYAMFVKVRGLIERDNWRRDTFHKKTYFIPLFIKIVESLTDYKKHITQHEIEATDLFKKNNNELFITLIIVIVFVFVYSLFLLFAIDLVVLKPIKNVAKAMKLRAFGHSYPKFGHVNLLETQYLVDAFNEMDQQIQKRQTELEHQALHDALTSLPNRTMLDERLKYHIATSKRNNSHLTLFLLDLNHFKQVNDSLGHHIGDLLLIKTSERLLECIRETDTLVRLGGDEFGILMPETKKEDSHVLAEKLSESLSQTFIINQNSIHITTSIGIVGYPEDGRDTSTLMQLADIAMYDSKQNKTSFALYNSSMQYHITNRVAILEDLHDAILNDQLELYFQPQVNLVDCQITGCEALLRWHHKTHGEIPPEEIIQLAEQFGIMNKLTHSIINEAVEQCKSWHNKGFDIGVSVNLSAQNLNDDELCNTVIQILKDHDLATRYLTLEITENGMMVNPGRAIDILKQLNKTGIMLSIDDFGTGFSSLSYLKDLPVQEVKIDKSFVIDMENNVSDQMIVQSTIDLGHNLGLQVVAEGVETISVCNKLREMGCDYGQGHWILKAVSSVDITDWFYHVSEEEKSAINRRTFSKLFVRH